MLGIAAGWQVIVDAAKTWWQDWSNQALVCLAAILLSLTIVLYPAALFGVFHEARDLTHGLRTGLAGFWKGFKTDFRNNLVWGMVNTVVLALLGLNIWFYANTQYSFAPALTGFSILLGVFWLSWQFFSLACLFLQEERSLKLAWKDGFAVMVSHPLYVTLISIPVLVLLFLSARYFIPLFFGAESLLALLGLMSIQRTLKA